MYKNRKMFVGVGGGRKMKKHMTLSAYCTACQKSVEKREQKLRIRNARVDFRCNNTYLGPNSTTTFVAARTEKVVTATNN